MRKVFLITFLVQSLVGVSGSVSAQYILWSGCYGGSSMDEAHSFAQTLDNGYIITGYTSSNDGDVSGNHGGRDFWVVKTDDNGILQWQKCLGGTIDEESASVEQTNDGGYIITGFTTSNDGDVTGLHNGYDVWVVKLDSSGNLKWQKALGGSLQDGVTSGLGVVAEIEQTYDGGYIVGTQTNSNDGDVTGNHGGFDYWLVKLDSAGGLQWQKCYGGSAEEIFKDMHQTLDGGFILAGRSNSTDGDVLGNNPSFGGNWIVKTDSSGTIEWQTNYIFSDTADQSGNGTIGISSILQQSNGAYVAAGTIYYTGYSYYYCTTLIDSVGNILSHHPDNYADNYNFCYSIQPTAGDGYILAGNSGVSHRFYVFGGGPGGGWTFDSGNLYYSVFCRSAIETSDGGCSIIGTSMGDTSCSPDLYQFRVIKLDGISSVTERTFTPNLTVRISSANNLYLTFSSVSPSPYLLLSLTDITGRTLCHTQLTAIAGTNKKEISLGDLAKGIYLVTLGGPEGSESVKFVKE